MRLVSTAVLFLLSLGVHAEDSPYLYVWAADEDRDDSDFLAVLDADPESDTYGDVLTTIEVGMPSGAHHTEHRMPEDGMLFMNGFRTGHSFVIDLNQPLNPSMVSHFTTAGELSHAHSFERLPNGNVLATFQNGPNGARITGGIAEIAPSGELVRWKSAAVAGDPEIRPYSLAVMPEIGMALTTTADMWAEVHADSVQVWRLADLSLSHTLQFPTGRRGDEQEWPMEPRLMADGETLIVGTSRCGLYQIEGLETDRPAARYIYSFDREDGYGCALPVTAGHYWVQTVATRNGLVSLDLSDVENPREVAYLDFGSGHTPHWIAIEPNDRRIVVTGFREMLNSITIVEFNAVDGSLSIDRDFGDNGVVDFGRTEWPHGNTGPAIPHGSIFSIP
jgi:hypothetical protein